MRRTRAVALAGLGLGILAWIEPWALLPLVAVLLSTWGAGVVLGRAPAHRGALVLGVGVPVLLLLGLRELAGPLGWAVPVGLAFYALRAIAYVADVARGRVAAVRDPVELVLLLAFAPALLAGPIEPTADWLAQLRAPPARGMGRVVSGLTLFAWGAVKKVAIADRVGRGVDAVFSGPEAGWPVIAAATVAFGLQLYADLSGYTDMARGLGRVLGFELSRNFDRPFLALTTPDFWRRWHTSLGRWVAAQVYEPLVVSGPRSPGRVALALVLSFLVVGLWHGGGATFVVFGLMHGAAAVVYTFGWPRLPPALRGSPAFLALAWCVHTFGVLLPSAVVFREVSLARAWAHLVSLARPVEPDAWPLAVSILADVAVSGGALAGVTWLGSRVGRARAERPWALVPQALLWAAAWALVEALRYGAGRSFLYATM